MERTIIREITFEQLFLTGFHSAEEADASCRLFLEDRDLLMEMKMISDRDLSEEEKEYLAGRCSAILEKTPEIDAAIDEVSLNWKTNRLQRVDLAILRLAVYEMRYDDAVPVAVAINEAVELAKKYGGEDSPSFVNAILGKLARQ